MYSVYTVNKRNIINTRYTLNNSTRSFFLFFFLLMNYKLFSDSRSASDFIAITLKPTYVRLFLQPLDL